MDGRAASVNSVEIDESPGGVSPPGAPRTVHDPLESHGSRCSAVAMTSRAMDEEGWIGTA